MNQLTSYLFAIAAASLLLVACGESKTAKKQTPEQRYASARNRDAKRIDSLEVLVRDQIKAQQNPDVRLSMYAIQGYEYFAADYPKDSLSPEYMFKAAQLYDGVLGRKKRAAEIYEKLYEKYPDYNKRGFVLFATANLYHELNDTTKAIESFKQFIAENPKHEFADDAQGLINYIRMDSKTRSQTFSDKAAAKQQEAKKPL